jgi:hypothetical protein
MSIKIGRRGTALMPIGLLTLLLVRMRISTLDIINHSHPLKLCNGSGRYQYWVPVLLRG